MPAKNAETWGYQMGKLFRLDIGAKAETDIIAGLLSGEVSGGWEELAVDGGKTIFRIHAERPEFLERLRDRIAVFVPDAEFEFSELPEQNWVDSWKEFFTPVECGKRFVVLPPWLAGADFGKRIKILIEPASAFGTGHHASSALCLGALDTLLESGKLEKGQKFLDLGCGSGILGLAAALTGLNGMGIDNDILAIDNAQKNRRLNGVENLELFCGSVEKARSGAYDLIMANILAAPLIEMAPDICGALKPGGKLVLSGILQRQAEEVRQAYEARGVTLQQTLARDEWVALIFS